MIRLGLIPRSSPASPAAAVAGVATGGTSQQVQPATASAVAPSATAVQFPQASRPSIPMEAVRAGLRTIIETNVVDLSVAHSFALGNALFVPLQGTAYMIDKGADVGVATIHIQDQTTVPVNTINVFPGDANNNIPFTFWVIENTAQAGKVLRIHYGTDIIFNPGLGGNVLFTGGVSISQTAAGSFQGLDKTTDAGNAYSRTLVCNANAAQKSMGQLFNPGASGKTIFLDSALVRSGGAAQQIYLINNAAALDTADGAPQGLNKKAGGPAPVATVNTNTAAAFIGGQKADEFSPAIAPAPGELHVYSPPLELTSGNGWVFEGNTNNIGFNVTFSWREY